MDQPGHPGAPSFEAFFAAEYKGLFQALYLICGSRAEAEDLAQEAMARAFERWDKVSSTHHPAAYVYRMAFNLNRKRLRRIRLGKEKRISAAPAPDPADIAERRAEVLRVLRGLPRGQQHALLLVEWLGLSPDEAAEILGIASASVRGRLHRARATVKARFGGLDD